MRENRITAIGNDLYSPNSRSFLNPFLHFLFKTRSSPPASRKGDAASSCSSTSSIASFSLPLSLFPVFSSIFSRFSISLSLSRNSSKSFSCVTRFRERKLSCLANHARPPPSPPPLLFPPFLSSFVHRGYALRHVQTQKFGANFVQA